MLKPLVTIGVCLGLMACGNASGSSPVDAPKSKISAAQADNKKTPLVDIKTATAPKWIVDKAKSKLEFVGEQSGEAFTGKFSTYDTQIYFDLANLKGSRVVVTVDMNSADAGDAERNDALPGKEWFYTKKFPKAKYEAATFERIQDGKYIAKGILTLRSTSLPLDLPFSLNITGRHAVMDARVNIDRVNYGVGTGVWTNPDWANHNVTVQIHLVAEKPVKN